MARFNDDSVSVFHGRLPGSSRPPAPFRAGSRVRLAADPDGSVGEVLVTKRGMVRVRWNDGDQGGHYIGHHSPNRLKLVPDEQQGPQAA